jgi:hypothetical protein
MVNNSFTLNNLTNDPSYDFIKNLQPNVDSDFDLNSPYDDNFFECNYSDISSFNSTYRNNTNLSIMSFNIQSISAKFSEFKELIISMCKCNSSPDIICLQELWNFSSNAIFSLPGYEKLIFKTRADGVQGGGVGFFVKSSLKCNVITKYSIFIDRVFE